jgi:signal transduction histidine kinase
MVLILLRRGAISVLARGFGVRSRLQTVRLLSDAVQHVVETKDFQPVAVPRATGELATLTSWFNQLLQMVALMRERQTRLLLDAGHELRNPLTSLRANVDLLALDLHNDRLSLDQRTEIVGDVQAQLGELSGLVTDLVHLARDEDEVKPEPVDVCEVVDGAVDRVRRRGQDRVFDVELQPLFMMGHAESFSRAVVNLLDNAVKWTPSGGTIRVRLTGNRLRVSDDGPGIPDADLPYVFDRFFRGQTGRGTPGTGLGLSIVAKTVREHGGSVQAGRAASGGAEFTVQLPGVTSREALTSVVQRSEAEQRAARSAAATAVLVAAELAKSVALAAQRARAAATAKAASAMAETVRQQALAVQDHADRLAREVAAAAARAASRVASAVLPGQEVEAQRTAALVAQTTTEAAAATAVQTKLAAAAATGAAAAAAVEAAAAADDADELIAFEVHLAATVIQDNADAAANAMMRNGDPAAGLTSG